MKNKNLKSQISSIANNNPTILKYSEISKKNKIKNIFLSKIVNYIPVLNNKKFLWEY